MAVRGIWVPVYPSLQNFGATIVQEASGAARKGSAAMQQEFRRGGRAAGAAAGQETAAGLRAQQGQIDRVSRKLAGARSAEADAAGNVRIAEAKLKEIRDDSNSSASKIAAAEEAAAKARRAHETQVNAIQTAEKELESIREGTPGVSRQVVRAEQQLQAARNAVDTANGNIRVAETKLNELRESGTATSSQIAAAEEKLEKARRQQTSAVDEVTTAQLSLTNAQQQAKAATEEGTQAVEEQEQSFSMSAETALKWSAAIGTAAVAVGTALFAVGSQFDDMGDAIRIGTGASGAALDDLSASAMNVARTTPALDGGMEQIGQTLADLNTRTGATGSTLETLTSQFIQLANMGMEADINTVTQAMTGFGISADQAPKAMDELLRVSQSTGLSIDDLANSAVKGGPALRQFGFGLADSAALAGQLDKAGMDADKTMAAMTKGLSAFAKENKNPKEALQSTVAEIQKFAKAGDDVGALNMASKLFGTRGAAQFVDAVKSGAFSVEGLKAVSDGTGDTILGLADDTADFAEQFQLFKQKALVAIEPVATRVFGVISQGMAWIADNGIPALKSASEFVNKFKGAFIALASAIGIFVVPALVSYGIAQTKAVAGSVWGSLTKIAGAWRTMGTALKSSAIAQWAMNSAILANPITWIVVALVAAGVALWAFFTKTETGRKLWETIWGGIKTAVAAVVDWFTQTVWPGMQAVFQKLGEIAMWLWNNAIQPAFNGIKTAIGWVVDHWKLFAGILLVFTGPVGIVIGLLGFLQAKFGFVTGAIKVVGAVISWLWNSVAMPAFRAIGFIIGAFWTGAQIVFNAFRAVIRVVGSIILWLWNNVAVPAFSAIGKVIGFFWSGVKVTFNLITTAIGWIGEKVTETKDLAVRGFTAIVDFVKGLPGRIAGAAKGMWDGIKDAFKAAVNWIIRGWNKIEFKIPGFKIGPVGYDGFVLGLPDIPELRSGGAIRDPNGRISGPGNGTSDSVLGVNAAGVPIVRVSDAETVVTASASADRSNAAALAYMNAGGSMSEFGLLPKRATGGPIGDYGLPAGTGISYGGSGFPEWVVKLGQEYGVQPSTYAGHQESDRNEEGYAANPQNLNRGIDWSGPVDKMQAFAEHLMEIAPKTPALEQVIWQNPNSGTQLGWHGRTKDDGSYFASDYSGHTDHVHTRQSADISAPQATYSETDPYPTQTPDADIVPQSPNIDGATTDTTDTATTSTDQLPTMGQLVGQAATEQFDDMASFLGFKDTWLYDPNKLGISTGKDDKSSTETTPDTTTTTPGADTTTPTTPDTGNQVTKVASGTISMGEYNKGSDFYAKEIAISAAERDLGEAGAAIGTAVSLVEAGNPIKMWANQAVPESLKHPHDAVGSDNDSIGPFQQRDNGAWGTVAQRMNARGSASMFFNAMIEKFPNWQTMEPGAVAQGVQVSAFPDRYAQQMDAAKQIVSGTGVFDLGGVGHGRGFMRKDIIEPERTLSPRQTVAFEEMVATNFAPRASNGSNVRVDVPTLGDDESLKKNKGAGRGDAPLVGTLQVQAIDVDDQVRKINRTLRDVAKSDVLVGGW